MKFLERHTTLGQAVYFTIFNFGVAIYSLRRWKRVRPFWPTICLLLLLHVSGVFLYSTHVQRIRVWQWPIVGVVEYCAAAYTLSRLSRVPW
jgi:hypothetical protein